jgi:hypothetical protein
MRLNTAMVVSAGTLIAGLVFVEDHLWIPASVLAAAIVGAGTRGWYSSDAVGEWAALSIILKFICALVGFYATVGQLVCVGLIGWWLVT